VTASSEGEGRGSEFVVRLPVWLDGSEHQPRPAPATAAPTMPKRILVVDDNEDAAATLVMLLQMSGNDTAIAYDGVEALEKASVFDPQIVVLDIGLPDMDGYEVCRELRARPHGDSLIIIALTGWGQEEDRKKSAAAGFDGHLVKPVDLARLNELLAKTGANAFGHVI
jgi:CheY-like chemotaxis protein